MKTLPLSEAKARFSKLVDAVAKRDERVTITRNGKPVALLMSPQDYEGLEATLEIMSDPGMMESIRRGIRNLDEGKVLSDEEVADLFGVTIEEVRGTAPRAPRRRRPAAKRGKPSRR